MSSTVSTLYGEVEPSLLEIAKQIKLLICDVDGVFSDGLIYMGNQGEELKTFHTRDGYGVKALMNAGIEIAIITGRRSQIVENRMKALGISLIYQGQDDKVQAYYDICQKLAIAPEQVEATLVMTSSIGLLWKRWHCVCVWPTVIHCWRNVPITLRISKAVTAPCAKCAI